MRPDRQSDVVLLGDSIFDNASYVAAGRSVPELLQRRLGAGWSVQNHAVDGNMVELIEPGEALSQIQRQRPTVVLLSVGGNNALWNVDRLADPTPRPAVESIARLQTAIDDFASRYDALLSTITTDMGLPLIGCTIYQPVTEEFPAAALAGALAMFNDAIVRSLHRRDLDWVELRDVCFEAEHFTNVIEPSSVGGERIANALADQLLLLQLR